jgi:hypothetical protein
MIRLINPEPNSYTQVILSRSHRIAKNQFETKVDAFHVDDNGKVFYYTKIR